MLLIKDDEPWVSSMRFFIRLTVKSIPLSPYHERHYLHRLYRVLQASSYYVLYSFNDAIQFGLVISCTISGFSHKPRFGV